MSSFLFLGLAAAVPGSIGLGSLFGGIFNYIT